MRCPVPPAYAPESEAPGAWDEALDADGTPRPSHVAALGALARTGLPAAERGVRDEIERLGLTFGEDAAPFHVCPVPRVVDRDEWDALSAGLVQRARALDAFVADVHGPRRSVADGVVPADVVDGCSFVEPDLVDLEAPPGVRIGVAGLDVVRDGQGTFRVLEDNCRTPSGLAYLLASRTAVDAALGVPDGVRDVRDAIGPALLRALRATAPETAGEGAAVMLSDGPANTAWWEHGRLSALMGIPLVTPDGLRARGDRLELRDTGEPVVAVYRRTDEDRLRRPDGGRGPIAALLLPAIRAGRVGVMNGFGTGVADDKAVYPHVPALIRYFCGEEPLLPDLPVHDLTDPDAREAVLERAAEIVLKPRDGFGGAGVTIGPHASPDELRETVARVRERPGAWIAQDAVVLSTHPTLVDGALQPRHVDLRPFVVADGRGDWSVLPGGLTRVALEAGQMIVNSSRGGGAKDTWVMA
jgi:uncharacterized circularly permuted ATP-grasp superfamily protein